MPRLVRAVLSGLAAMALVLVAARWNPWQHVTLDEVRALVGAWGPLGPLAFMAIMIGGFFLPGPQVLLVAVGGMLFGSLWGFVYSWAAAVIGTGAAFLLVRYTAQGWAQRALRDRFPRLRALDRRLEQHGIAMVALLRLLLFLAPPLSWALGASRVRTTEYVLGTAVGILPMRVLVVLLADRVAAAGSVIELLDRDVLLPGAALALLIGVGVRVGRRMLAGPSGPGEQPGGRQAHRRPAGQGAALERGQHGGRPAAFGETEKSRQGLH